MVRRAAGFGVLLGSVAAAALAAAQGRYLETSQFLAEAFPDGEPAAAALWITNDVRGPVEQALGHRFGQLRVRYWRRDDRTAWILDEIGKEQPITIGVVVDGGAIESVRILEFREVRGWEVRYPFFTDQFHGATLTADQDLDRDIDGITGATLSVGAVTRVARTALLLDAHVRAE